MTTEPMPEYLRNILIEMANTAAPREMCGFLHRDWSGITIMENVSERDDRFEIPDEALMEFYSVYPNPLGFFHSHPSGRRGPSNRDVEYAPQGMRYWIVTLSEVVEWDMSNDPPAEISA